MNVETIIIRRSPVMAIFRLVVVLVVLSLIFAAAFSFIGNDTTDSRQLQMLHVQLLAIYSILSILLAIVILWQWAFEWFEVREGLMVHHKGIIFRRTTGTSLQHLEEISVREGLFGRILKYGTLVLHNPMLKQQVTLHDVLDPLVQARALRSAIGKQGERIVPLAQ